MDVINKIFKEKFGMTSMMLHASEILFNHPITERKVLISAGLHSEFKRMVNLFGWEKR